MGECYYKQNRGWFSSLGKTLFMSKRRENDIVGMVTSDWSARNYAEI
jgi:hypothetical protein